PPLFSTTTGWPSECDILSATMRATRSADPPGGYGTTSLMGRLGNLSCANAAVPTIAATSSIRDLLSITCLLSLRLRGPLQHYLLRAQRLLDGLGVQPCRGRALQ